MENTENQEVTTFGTLQDEGPKTSLPMSYVLWLTWRSKFVDHIAKINPLLLDQWKEFENVMMQDLEMEYTSSEESSKKANYPINHSK